MQKKIRKLIFEQYLKEDYTRSAVLVAYHSDSLAIQSVFINHYLFGTLEIIDGKREVHRWENEDEAKEGSFLNRHYTSFFLDGAVEDNDFESKLLKAVSRDILEHKTLENKKLFLDLLTQIGEGINYLVLQAKPQASED